MNERTSEILRGYVLPVILAGNTLGMGLSIAGEAVLRFIRPDPIPRNAIIEINTSSLPEDRLEFLGPYNCTHVQYGFSDKLEGQLESELGEKSKEFMDKLRLKGYFPAPNAVQRLTSLNDGIGYDLGEVRGTDKWILTYRTRNSPKPFQPGFTLIEHGTNQSVKDRFGQNHSPKEGQMNYFVMNSDGVIEYVITLDPESYENCTALRPQQLMFRMWLQGGPWEDLVFARTQKQVARKLEEIARNPNPTLLRREIESEKSL